MFVHEGDYKEASKEQQLKNKKTWAEITAMSHTDKGVWNLKLPYLRSLADTLDFPQTP